MLKAIIFDFDGVIGNTYSINFELSKQFHEGLSEQDFKDHHNGNVFEKPKINFKKGDYPIFFERQKHLFHNQHLFPVKDVLPVLVEKFKLFIVSSTIDENVKYFLQLGNLTQFFTKILGSTTNPSKEVKFKMILSEEKLNPNECLFITDTIGDIIEARKLNIRVIAVTWGFHEKVVLEKEKPYKIVNNEKELLEAIHKIDSNS